MEKKGAETLCKCYLEYFCRRKACVCVYSREMNPLQKKIFFNIINALVMNKAGSQDATKFPCGQIVLRLLLPFCLGRTSRGERPQWEWNMSPLPSTSILGSERHLPPAPGDCHTARKVALLSWRDQSAGRDMVERTGTPDFKFKFPFCR